MTTALDPSIEDQRLRALEEYGLSADVMQDAIGPLNQLAIALFGVPISMVSFITQDQAVAASRIGISVCSIHRNISFCPHVFDRDQPLVVLDASRDPRFEHNPLVTGPSHARFYAGAPLRGPAGHVIGSFCIADTRPRASFNDEDIANLQLFAGLALSKLELRRLERAHSAGERRFQQMSDTSPTGIVCADHEGTIRFWNHAAEKLFGFSAAEAVGASIDLIVPKRLRGGHGGDLQRVAAGGTPKLVGKTMELIGCRKDGSEIPIELALSMWHDDGRASFGAIIHDLTERRANEQNLYRLAHFDGLTELPNRTTLRQRVLTATQTSEAASLLIIDLDGFKQVNDTLGHSVGDLVLREVAQRLIGLVGSVDTVARLGGDEFAVLLPTSQDLIQASDLADRIIDSMAQPVIVDGQLFQLSGSVGIAFYPLHADTAEDLISAADLALYAAKAAGKNCRRLFDPCMRRSAVSKRVLENELHNAADSGEFELFYQPQVCAQTGALTGAEALIRWRHPQHGLLSPGAFLPGLEGSALAARVGHWVLHTACKQAAVWRRASPHFRMGVNLFGAQFRVGDIVDDVCTALAGADLSPDGLELEVTENIILRHDDAMLRPLCQLRERGIRLAFDDYGTGYASLSMLKRYPITRLKIDQSFVRNLSNSKQDAAIVRAVVGLGKAFGLNIIAEGVETEEQHRRLADKGCDELQGFLFGRPMPAGVFEGTFGLSPITLPGQAA